MSISYRVFAFRIPKDIIKNHAQNQSLKQFWEKVETKRVGLSEAIGCYLYSVRAGRGLTPWYVGMTRKLGFRNECFQPGKLLKLRSVLDRGKKGNLIMHLIPKVTGRGKFVKKCKGKNSYRDVQWLENYLSGLALRKNPGLEASKGLKFLKEVHVPGVLTRGKGSGKLSSDAASLRTSLGL